MRKKSTFLLVALLLILFGHCQEKNDPTGEPSFLEETETHRGEVRADLGIRTNPSISPSAEIKVYSDYMFALPKGKRLFMNGLLGYHWPVTLDLGIGYPIGKHSDWIAPRVGVLLGTHFGMDLGFVSKMGNEKVHMLTQHSFIFGFNKRRDEIFSLVEIGCRPVRVFEFGVEPELTVQFIKKSEGVTYEPEAETEFLLTTFIRFHIKERGFIGLGYQFEPLKINREPILDISVIKLIVGGEW